jgi:hypothetical protein
MSYFMAPGGLSQEYESESSEPFDDFSIPKSGENPHYVATSSG